MKTLNNTQKNQVLLNTNGNGNSILLRIVLLSIFTLFITKKSFSQSNLITTDKKIGLALYTNINVNGYGAEYLPGVFYKSKRKSIFIAPTIQYQKGRLSGTNIMFQYVLFSPETNKDKESDCKLELFTFLSAGFHYHALMGKTPGKYEQVENPDYFKNNISNYKYNSIEGFGGIGLGIPFLKRFKWVNYIGVGGFYTLNPNKLTRYYNNNSFGLMYRTGISFEIK